LAKLAEQGRPGIYHFPRPMVDRPGLEFSFSGLKTFTLTCFQSELQKGGDEQQIKADIALAFEEAVVDTLMIKCRRALQQTGINRLVVAGGVGANKRLRQVLRDMTDRLGGDVFYPRIEFCTDNAAMIAYVGCLRLMAGETESLAINVRARWPMSQLGKLNSSS
jgi:N6-L-threonylcarbamoyladenine synthase